MELARKSKALQVRSQVAIRWSLWLTRPGGAAGRWETYGLAPPRRDERMLHILRDGPAEAVPMELLATAVHARDEAEAQTLAATFERGRDGYARTRAGREEDPVAPIGAEPFGVWALPEVRGGAGPGLDRAGPSGGERFWPVTETAWLATLAADRSHVLKLLHKAEAVGSAARAAELRSDMTHVETLMHRCCDRIRQSRQREEARSKRVGKRRFYRLGLLAVMPGLLGDAARLRRMRADIAVSITYGFMEEDSLEAKALAREIDMLSAAVQAATGEDVGTQTLQAIVARAPDCVNDLRQRIPNTVGT